jgi:hypothetical protein
LENRLTTIYKNIPNCAQEPKDTPEGKFQNIVQVMEKYKKEITELTKNSTPSTSPKVREKMEHDATLHIDNIAQEAKDVQELYEITIQIWTILEEDEKM